MTALPSATAVTTPLITVATKAFDVLHSTAFSSASLGLMVAISVVFCPSTKVTVFLSRETLSTGVVIVTEQVADFSPAFAIIVTIPLFNAVTRPFWSTLAMVASLLDQVTVLSVALSGLTVALRVSDWPLVRFRLVLLSVTDVTATTDFLTDTAQVADLPPALAVITAFPSELAVTKPLKTVATSVFDDVQVTDLSVAFPGETETSSWMRCPTSIAIDAGLTVTDDTVISSAPI